MKAAVIESGKLSVKEINKPELTEKGAIIKVKGCGLCGSDIVKLITGSAKDGKVLGHEVVGEIVEIDSDTNFKVGDRVVLGHHIPCFDCTYCKSENYSMCKEFKQTNIFPGGFADYIFASERHLQYTAFKPSGDISDEEASFMEPLGCCVRAVRRTGLAKGSKVLVIGLGSVGLLMGQAAKAFGYEVYGSDLLEERIELSKKLGFKNSFISKNADETSELIKKEVSEIGVDGIFMTSGSDKTFDLALKSVRDGGTILVFSSVKTDAGYTNNDIYYRELKIMGSYSPAPVDLQTSLKLLETKEVKVEGLSTHYELGMLNEAIADTTSNKIIKAYINL